MIIALAILFALLPTYLIRFHIGPLPTTVLEVMIWAVIALTIIRIIKNQDTKNKIQTNLKYQITNNKLLFIGILLLLVGATISIFSSVNLRGALGEWKAFYVEPILIFIILISTINNEQLTTNKKNNYHLSFIIYILLALILSGLITSILAIYQHFTGFGVPSAFWENGNSYRVTAWYGFPNAVGLFLAPLVPLAFYLLIKKIQDTRTQVTNIGNYLYLACLPVRQGICILFLVAAPLAIFYAKSTGAIIGILAGIFVLLLVYKKTRWPALIACLLGLLGIVSLSSNSQIKQELFFQDRSGQIRIAIYKETLELLKDRPILGTGLASYSERIAPYHTTVNGEGIEIFHHPHNILLTMWVNTGLIGLLGFIGIIVWFYKESFAILRKQKLEIPVLLASMTTILVVGFVDSPYIKNDLALLFWLLPALLITYDRETI